MGGGNGGGALVVVDWIRLSAAKWDVDNTGGGGRKIPACDGEGARRQDWVESEAEEKEVLLPRAPVFSTSLLPTSVSPLLLLLLRLRQTLRLPLTENSLFEGTNPSSLECRAVRRGTLSTILSRLTDPFIGATTRGDWRRTACCYCCCCCCRHWPGGGGGGAG